MTLQLVQQAADDNGQVAIDEQDVHQPDVDLDINVRDDDFQLFESEHGDLFFTTDEMPTELYVEVTPTSEGVVTTLRADVDNESLTTFEPADRSEIEGETGTRVETRTIVD